MTVEPDNKRRIEGKTPHTERQLPRPRKGVKRAIQEIPLDVDQVTPRVGRVPF